MPANLKDLHPKVREAAEKLQKAADKRLTGNYKMLITQGFRTMEEQAAIYAQGRTKPGPKVSMAPAGYSPHNYGLAIDFALVTKDGKKAIWDANTDFDGDKRADWLEIVDEAKKLGFEWGGDWTGGFVDRPHLQMMFGLTIKDLRAGKRPAEDGKAVEKTAPVDTDIVPYPGHILEKGHMGKNVERIQRAVGLAEKDVDGEFGPKTEAAVKAYQKKHKLKVDGRVGRQTWGKMF